MDKQRCRFLLRAIRPNGADASDPTLREAADQARTDPELSAWFAREQAIDSCISAKLGSVEPPADLRAQILSGSALEERRRWRQPWFLALSAAAALVALAAGIYTALPSRPRVSPFDQVVAAAFNEVQGSMALSYYSAAITDVQTWLVSEHAPAPGRIPVCFSRFKTIGCRTFDWDGVHASVVCFRVPGLYRDASGASIDAVMHLFTVNQASCSGGTATGEPMVFTKADHSVATWRDADRFYVLMVRAPEPALRTFLGEESGVAMAAPQTGPFRRAGPPVSPGTI
jgi:hypothetical protein